MGDFLQCSCYKFIKLRVAVTHNHNQIVWGLLSVCVSVCALERKVVWRKQSLKQGERNPNWPSVSYKITESHVKSLLYYVSRNERFQILTCVFTGKGWICRFDCWSMDETPFPRAVLLHSTSISKTALLHQCKKKNMRHQEGLLKTICCLKRRLKEKGEG